MKDKNSLWLNSHGFSSIAERPLRFAGELLDLRSGLRLIAYKKKDKWFCKTTVYDMESYGSLTFHAAGDSAEEAVTNATKNVVELFPDKFKKHD